MGLKGKDHNDDASMDGCHEGHEVERFKEYFDNECPDGLLVCILRTAVQATSESVTYKSYYFFFYVSYIHDKIVSTPSNTEVQLLHIHKQCHP